MNGTIREPAGGLVPGPLAIDRTGKDPGADERFGAWRSLMA